AQPFVVGFAGGRALERVDHYHAFRHLVRGECRAAMVAQRVGVDRVTVARLYQRDDHLAPAVVGYSDHHAVVYVVVRPERELHLFGIHLLATGVDTRRAPAEQANRSVGVDGRVVARDRVSPFADRAERRRGLLGILVVAERDGPTDPEHADHLVAGLHEDALVGHHHNPFAGLESRGRDLVTFPR